MDSSTIHPDLSFRNQYISKWFGKYRFISDLVNISFSMLLLLSNKNSWFLINLLPPPHHSIRILWWLDLSHPRIGAFYEFHGNSPKSKKWGRRNCWENTEIWWVQAISWWKITGVELRRNDMLTLLRVVRFEPFLFPLLSSTWSIIKHCECIGLSVVEVHCIFWHVQSWQVRKKCWIRKRKRSGRAKRVLR